MYKIEIGIKIMYNFTFKAGYSSSVKGTRAKGAHIFRKCASVHLYSILIQISL